MVNNAVLAMHAEEAPFLWGQRRLAVEEAHYTLDALVRLDDRLRGHLEGLRVDPEAGQRHVRHALATLDTGVVFMAGALAFQDDAPAAVRNAFAAASALPDGLKALASALAWHADDASLQWCRQLLASATPAHRVVALDALRLRRSATASEVIDGIADAEAAVRAAAARAAGDCRLTASRAALSSLQTDVDPACRFWATRSLTLLGDSEAALRLASLCGQPAWGWRAAQLSLRALPLSRSRDVVRGLLALPGAGTLAVAAVGIIGDPQSLPWLLEQMEQPEMARVAAEAFSHITGLDLVREDLAEEEPDGLTLPASDTLPTPATGLPDRHEDSLPPPALPKLKAWWDRHRTEFHPGQRYLGGQPISIGQALQVLRSGKQRERAAAALELAMLEPSTALLEVRAPGRQQRHWMAAWNS